MTRDFVDFYLLNEEEIKLIQRTLRIFRRVILRIACTFIRNNFDFEITYEFSIWHI